jgi:hypothetical protein
MPLKLWLFTRCGIPRYSDANQPDMRPDILPIILSFPFHLESHNKTYVNPTGVAKELDMYVVTQYNTAGPRNVTANGVALATTSLFTFAKKNAVTFPSAITFTLYLQPSKLVLDHPAQA